VPISAALRQGSHNQGCNGGESLATCGKFDRLGIWIPYHPHQKRTSYHLYYPAGYNKAIHKDELPTNKIFKVPAYHVIITSVLSKM